MTPVERVQERIATLDAVAERWAPVSPRLAQRARDKAEGMVTALRILTGGQG